MGRAEGGDKKLYLRWIEARHDRSLLSTTLPQGALLLLNRNSTDEHSGPRSPSSVQGRSVSSCTDATHLRKVCNIERSVACL
jgi:hypothetical protein